MVLEGLECAHECGPCRGVAWRGGRRLIAINKIANLVV